MTNCISTKYGDISLVKAQNILLQKAISDDNDNSLMIFVSNSCIPLKSFNYIYNLLNAEFSYFNLEPHIRCFPRCNYALKFISKDKIQKASQWSILNRKHSNLMISNEDYLSWFSENIFAPDEHCYITNIFNNNLQNEIIYTYDITNGATTFANWTRYTTTYAVIKNYDYIIEKELLDLLNSKSLFGRKFKKTSLMESCLNIQTYLDSISTLS